VAADVERVVSACVHRFGRLDILVNSAAVQIYARFEDYEWREIERVFDVTCFGYLRFARAALRHFRARGSGHVINVLSMPWVGAAILGRWGAALQTLDRPVERPRGNLFEPVPAGVGPRGSIPPTPRWIRYGATAAIFASLGAALAGALALTAGIFSARRAPL